MPRESKIAGDNNMFGDRVVRYITSVLRIGRGRGANKMYERGIALEIQ